MIEQETALELFRNDKNSWGQHKAVLTKVKLIYKSRGTCGECINNKEPKSGQWQLWCDLMETDMDNKDFCSHFERK